MKNALRNLILQKFLRSSGILNPGYNQKLLIGKGITILDKKFFNYERLFHPVQCTARKTCQCSSKDKIVLSRVAGILSISDQLPCL